MGVFLGANYVELSPGHNVPASFSNPLSAGLYIVAMTGLGFHLWHGVYSMFGSLGLTHPLYTEKVKKVGRRRRHRHRPRQHRLPRRRARRFQARPCAAAAGRARPRAVREDTP